MSFNLTNGRQWKKRVWPRLEYPRRLLRWNSNEVYYFSYQQTTIAGKCQILFFVCFSHIGSHAHPYHLSLPHPALDTLRKGKRVRWQVLFATRSPPYRSALLERPPSHLDPGRPPRIPLIDGLAQSLRGRLVQMQLLMLGGQSRCSCCRYTSQCNLKECPYSSCWTQWTQRGKKKSIQ